MKRALLFGLPLLVLGLGSVVGLAYIGVVDVPFLPFKKKGPKPPKDDGRGGPFAALFVAVGRLAKTIESEAAVAKAPPTPPAPPIDREAGEKKLAALWAEMPTDRLIALVARWPEPQLGRIVARMEEEAVTNLLSTLPPPRAASLSRSVAAATDERAAKVRTDAEK